MNDEQLAADIRRAFGRYHARPRPIELLAATSPAADVTPAAVSVRPPLLARRRLLGGLSFAGVAAAVAVAFALTLGIAPGGSGPKSVWAAWQPEPSKPDETMRQAASSRCRETLNLQSWEKVPGSSFTFDELTLIAQDQRGPAAVFMFARGTTFWGCMIWPNALGTYDALGLGSSSEMHPLVGHIEMATEGGSIGAISSPTPTDPKAVMVFGRTDAAKVAIERADGVRVQATVQDGVFVAWWPGGGAADDLTAYDSKGVVLEVQHHPFGNDRECLCVVPSGPPASAEGQQPGCATPPTAEPTRPQSEC